MENTASYLLIMMESLNKKVSILDELIELTELQKKLLHSAEFDDNAFNDSIDKKSFLIGELEKLDNGFQSLFDRISSEIEGKREIYRSEIKDMQDKITMIMDKSVHLQTLEARNKALADKTFISLKKEVKEMKKSRQTAANYYKSMNKITEESFFVDKKK